MKHPYTTANRAEWLAFQFFKKKNPALTPNVANGVVPAGVYRFHGVFPVDLAKDSGMTRLESELALRCLEYGGMAKRRRDGRYFLTEKGRNA